MISAPSSRQVTRNYSKQTKQAHIKTWKMSRLTMSDYCRKHDLAIATFSTWVAKFKEENKPAFMAIERPEIPPYFEPIKNSDSLTLSISLPNQITFSIKIDRDVKFLVSLIREL